MKEKTPYQAFSKFVLRTSLFPLSLFKNLTSEKRVDDLKLKVLCNEAIFKEALFLASPTLHTEMEKWLQLGYKDPAKSERLKISLLKYISRMSSRCTPFGLFAGCRLGRFGTSSCINIKEARHNKRHTRLDMNYLVALSQDLAQKAEIKQQLLFFPNSSIYNVGKQIRYIEYYYFNATRKHKIVEVTSNEYIDIVLAKSEKGALLEDLASSLTSEEITIKEAREFISDLVANQLLVSELEPAVSGPEFMEQIIEVLKRLQGVNNIVQTLQSTQAAMRKLDETMGNPVASYAEITDELKNLGTDFEDKYMFQTDMLIDTTDCVLDSELLNELKKGLWFLNNINPSREQGALTEFKNAFSDRFDMAEVPLSTALDVELGIGYGQNRDSGGTNPLVDDIVLPIGKKSNENGLPSWNLTNELVHKKLIDATRKRAYKFSFEEADLDNLPIMWDDLPDTISCMVQLLKIDGETKIKFSGFGGSSAGNLIGRFCHSDAELADYLKEIVEIERDINHDKILAEIVHLPESRVGNILMRPAIRKFEIPYLAKSVKSKDKQLSLDDLSVSINSSGKLVLTSKNYNKEVVPRLTNAHNYATNSLPLYNFLGDMQSSGKRSSFLFDYGPLAQKFEFLPRVEFGNLILHNATWNLKKGHIEKLLKPNIDDFELEYELKRLRKEFQMPQYVTLSEGDNKLLINLENLTSVKMLLNTVKTKEAFVLVEFLFDNDCIVKNEKGFYTNQLIVSFYNSRKVANSKLN